MVESEIYPTILVIFATEKGNEKEIAAVRWQIYDLHQELQL